MRFGPPPRIMTLRLVAAARFVLVAVGRIIIGRVRLELRRAGIHEPVGRQDVRASCAAARTSASVRSPPVRCASCRSEKPSFFARRSGMDAGLVPVAGFLVHQLADVVQKPRVDAGQPVDFLDREPGHQRVADGEDALGVRHGQPALDRLAVPLAVGQERDTCPCRRRRGRTGRFPASAAPFAAPP